MESKQLVEELRQLAGLTPPICHYDRPRETEIFGKKIVVHCKPFVQFQDTLRQAADRIEESQRAFNRLGKFGRLFLDYKGCPRGPMGRMGDGHLKDEAFIMGVITDVDGGRWVPVQESVLCELVEGFEAQRPKGRWVYDDGNLEWACSECLRAAHFNSGSISGYILSDFCPNCGAKMEG